MNAPFTLASLRQSVRTQANHLRSVEAGHGFDDLSPLAGMIGDARIVAVGKATHGTREFFLLKHRLVEFLVAELGLTTFATEANWTRFEIESDYIVTSRSTATSLGVRGNPVRSCSNPQRVRIVVAHVQGRDEPDRYQD